MSKGKEEAVIEVIIPEEHLKVINEADLQLLQFANFMNADETFVTITTEKECEGALTAIIAVKEYYKRLEDSKEAVVGPAYADYMAKGGKFNPLLKKIKEKIDSLNTAARNYQEKAIADANEKQKILDIETAATKLKAEADLLKANEKVEIYREAGREDLATKWEGVAQEKETIATQTVAPAVSVAMPKNVVGGFNLQKKYIARIMRVEELLDYFKASCPPNVLEEIQTWANAQARVAKGAKSMIPGVEFIKV